MVVDDGVDVGPAHQRVRSGALGFVWCGGRVMDDLLSADEAVPSTVGDVAEFRDVDVDHRPGVGCS